MSAAARLLNLTNPSAPSASRSAECVAFVGDDETRRLVGSVCRRQFPEIAVIEGASREAMDYLAGVTVPPKVLIVDVTDSAKPLSTMLSIAAAFAENTKIIAIGSVNDIALYREMREGGVSEYLVKPVLEKSLAEAMTPPEPEIAKADKQPAQKKSAEIIAVVGSRGGVGSTTIAVNAAWLIAREKKMKTLLVDLDLQFGTVALQLDIEPTRGLREALENPSRIDSLFLNSAAARMGDNFAVMAAEEAVDTEINFDASAIDLLIYELSHQYQVLMIDLPRAPSQWRSRVLQLVHKVVVVTDMTLPSLRDCIRVLAVIERSAPQAQILVVANQAAPGEGRLSRQEFEKALGHSIAVLVPTDDKVVAGSINKGRAAVAVAPSSRVAKSLRTLVERLAAIDGKAKAKTKGLWSKLRRN